MGPLGIPIQSQDLSGLSVMTFSDFLFIPICSLDTLHAHQLVLVGDSISHCEMLIRPVLIEF